MYWSISSYINFCKIPLEVLNTFLKEIEGDSLLITESTSGFEISSSCGRKIYNIVHGIKIYIRSLVHCKEQRYHFLRLLIHL